MCLFVSSEPGIHMDVVLDTCIEKKSFEKELDLLLFQDS